MIKGVFIGDGDELDFTYEVERVFGIKLSDEECAACRTMGDVEALVWKHVSQRSDPQDRCMTALAFQDVRRAFPGLDGQRKIRPKTALAEFGVSAGQFHQKLGETAGVDLICNLSLFGGIGLFAYITGMIFCIPFGLKAVFSASPEDLGYFAAVVALIAFGIWGMRGDPGTFGAARSAGDMARRLADRNFAAYAARGGRYHRDSVWQTLRRIAGEDAGCNPNDIVQETPIIIPGWFRHMRRTAGAA